MTLVNSLSKHTGDKDSANTKLPPMTSRGQVKEPEDGEPKKEDLQRICDLLDGFRASKVIRNKPGIHMLIKDIFHIEILMQVIVVFTYRGCNEATLHHICIYSIKPQP